MNTTNSHKTKGKTRAKEIKTLAHEILATEGYSSFTLRNISSRLSISMGNLNYYFTKKQDLLQALIQDARARYEADTKKIFEQSELSSEEQFEQFISYLINDLQNPLTRGFFLQLWAVATHEPEVESYRQDFYSYGINRISDLLGHMTSGVREESIQARAMLIIAAIEGSMLLITVDSRNKVHRQVYLDKLKQHCLDIALNG